MPSWKKVIVSGSDAVLNSLNVTNAVTASFFTGDGSGLTNLPSSSGFPFTGSAEITGSLQVIGPTNLSGSLTASGLIYPTIDGTINQAIITDGAGNLSFGEPYASNTIVTGKNLSGGTIAKGTPLYFTGSGTSGNIVGVFPADAGDSNRMPAGGVAGEQILNGDEGVVLLNGFINGVNTSAFSSGDEVFVAVGGGYTNVTPTGSALIQHLGYVEKSAVNGSGVINMMGEVRALPNIQQGYAWVGNADGVPVAVATSSIQNVISASFATTASYALSAAGFGETTKLFQTTASTTWSFSHNLGDQYPQIDIYSGENKIIIPSEIEAIDENNMLIYFASPQSGVAAASVGGTATTASYANTFTIETVTLKTDQNTDVDTGTEVISTVSATFYDGAFFDYRIKSGSNLRVGTVTSVWDGTNIEFNDVSTNDIGNTSPVTMSVDISASFARLLATTSTDNWDIKTFVRMI